MRIFKTRGDATRKHILFGGQADIVKLVELHGRIVKTLNMQKDKIGADVSEPNVPGFGVGTIRFCNAQIQAMVCDYCRD